MDKNIYFDHTYTGDQGHQLWKKLGRLGFTLDKLEVKHPNDSCRFILFEKPSYLEFIHSSGQKYAKKCPGFSFGVRSDLKSFFNKLKKKKIDCTFMHRNYDWAKNDKDYLPGWNFVDFKNFGIRTFFPWITEYEQDPAVKVRKRWAKHPNAVSHIIGHEFVINERGEKFFSNLLGTKIQDKVILSCGTILYFSRGQTNFHSKVILGSKNLKKTKTFMAKLKVIDFCGKDGILIPNPSSNKRMWDIIITQIS